LEWLFNYDCDYDITIKGRLRDSHLHLCDIRATGPKESSASED